MLNTLNRVIYKSFGLHVISEIPLPELFQVNDKESIVDVEVTIMELDLKDEQLISLREDVFVKDNLVMFQISEIATFTIQDGNKIIVSPMDGFNEDAARLYILGTCMGAILLQRGILPLHGSAIVIDGKAYGFVGDSGAGKSTLASAFLRKGYKLLTDDVIAITLSQNDIPVVTPSYPQQKLWQESLNAFGVARHQYRPLLERETKYAVPVPTQFKTDSIPLAGIFELIISPNEQVEILPIQGLQRLQTLFHHTYRNFIIEPAGLMEWHFQTLTRFVHKIVIFQLRRPVSRFTAHDLPEMILKTLEKEE
jgi:hypothetical protein